MTDLFTMSTEVKSVIASEVIVQSITDGDTTHIPSADAVYDYIASIIGDIEEDMLS